MKTLIATVVVLAITHTTHAATPKKFNFGDSGTPASLRTWITVINQDRSGLSSSALGGETYGDIRGTGTLDELNVTVSDVRLGPFDVNTSASGTFDAWSNGKWREFSFGFSASGTTTVAYDDFASYIKPYSPKSVRGYAESGEYLLSASEPVTYDWYVQGPETLLSGTELMSVDPTFPRPAFSKGQTFQFTRYTGEEWNYLTRVNDTGYAVVFDGALDGANLSVAIRFDTAASLVPEPSGVVLFAVGLLGLVRFRCSTHGH